MAQKQTIAEFLLERIAEDVARTTVEGAPLTWRSSEDGNVYGAGGHSNEPIAVGPWGSDIGPVAEHIAQWDPARVLAECEAKKRLIELHPVTAVYVSERRLIDAEPKAVYVGYDIPLELCIIAQPYREHPDFQIEWRL